MPREALQVREVQFVGSSARDGVQSRGAGWHLLPEGALRQRRRGVALVRGELVRRRSPSGHVLGFQVFDGRRLVGVPPPSSRALVKLASSSSVLAEWLGGSLQDWEWAWTRAAYPAAMVKFALALGARPSVVKRVLCEVVDLALRLPGNGPCPGRIVRLARDLLAAETPERKVALRTAAEASVVCGQTVAVFRYVAGAAESTADAVLAKTSESVGNEATHVMVDASLAIVNHFGSAGDLLTVRESLRNQIRKQMAWFVTARLPLSDLCLLVAESRRA